MGKKKSYFVDVVVDGLEMDEDGGYKRPEGTSILHVSTHTPADHVDMLQLSPTSSLVWERKSPIRLGRLPQLPPNLVESTFEVLGLISKSSTRRRSTIVAKSPFFEMYDVLSRHSAACADGPCSQHFATPLRTRAAAHDGLLTSKQTEQLFSNLDQLVTLSQEFLSDLEATCPELQDEDDVTNEEYLPTQFGRVVLRNVRSYRRNRTGLIADSGDTGSSNGPVQEVVVGSGGARHDVQRVSQTNSWIRGLDKSTATLQLERPSLDRLLQVSAHGAVPASDSVRTAARTFVHISSTFPASLLMF